jgi:hypothetical protein
MNALRELQQGSYFAKNPLSIKKNSFPNEFVDLFNQIGYKEWFLFNGNTEQTLALADHVRSVLNYKPAVVPGIRVLQHHASVHGSRLVSLDPLKLPLRFSKLFQKGIQTKGDVVYTDTRLHVGRGICTFNTAWSILPLGLFLRNRDSDLGMCSPITFNETAALLTRGVAGIGHDSGQWDSISSRLFQLLFTNIPSHFLKAILLKDFADPLGAFLQLETRLEELQQACVEGCDERLLTMSKCAKMSAQRAVDIYKRSFLCSKCGIARVLKHGWVPKSILEDQECDMIVWLCHVCALDEEGPVLSVPEDHLLVRAKATEISADGLEETSTGDTEIAGCSTDDDTEPSRKCRKH